MRRKMLTLLLVCVSLKAFATPLTITVLTLSTLPRPTLAIGSLPLQTSITISNVDTLSQFLALATARTRGLTHQAVKQTFAQLAARYQRSLQKSIKGIALAKTLGVTQIPAMIFNHHYIVYGTLDVQRAFNAYQTYQLEPQHD